MARWLDAVQTRLAAILESGYGTGRTVTASAFRSRQYSVPVDHPEYPLDEIERTYEIRWGGSADTFGDRNDYSGEASEDVRFDLVIGYRYDLDAPAIAPAATAGDSATQDASRKALDDWAVIKRAIRWTPNWAGTIVYGCTPGAAAINDRGDGVLFLRVPIDLSLSFDPATVWDVS